MDKIYKYVTHERIDILETCRIRVTQPKYLNDPFDSVLFLRKILEKEKLLQHFKAEDVMKNFQNSLNEKLLKRNLNLDNLLNQYNKTPEDLSNIISQGINKFVDLLTSDNQDMNILINEILNEKLGVISFTETPDNIPMWAYYAEVHRGLVYIFDAAHSFFFENKDNSSDFEPLQKIIYSSERTILNSINDICAKPFYEKHERWRNEEEWRMIYSLSQAQTHKYPDIYLLDIPSEIITGIIFGSRTEVNLIEYVKEMVSNNPKWENLKLYQAFPKQDCYNMNIISIS